jgi:hypothetical protein
MATTARSITVFDHPDPRFVRMRTLLSLPESPNEYGVCLGCGTVASAAVLLSNVVVGDSIEDELRALADVGIFGHPMVRSWITECARSPSPLRVRIYRGAGKVLMFKAMASIQLDEKKSAITDAIAVTFDLKSMPVFGGRTLQVFCRRSTKQNRTHEVHACRDHKVPMKFSAGEMWARDRWPEGKGIIFTKLDGWSKTKVKNCDALPPPAVLSAEDLIRQDLHDPDRDAACIELITPVVTGMLGNGSQLYRYSRRMATKRQSPGVFVAHFSSWADIVHIDAIPTSKFTFTSLKNLRFSLQNDTVWLSARSLDFTDTFAVLVIVQCWHSNCRRGLSDSWVQLLTITAEPPMVDLPDNLLEERYMDPGRLSNLATNHIDMLAIEKSRGIKCDSCRTKFTGRPHKCQGCLGTFYCNKECQRKGWKVGGHRHMCTKIKEAVEISCNEMDGRC